MFKIPNNYLYFIFRVLIGLLFLQHGAQKLFGILGGAKMPLLGLMGLAGLIEFIAGLFIFLGLFTRLTAFIAGIEMIFAYFMAHISKSWIPILNGGELAILYLAAFLVIFSQGAVIYSLEKKIFKKEFF